MTPYLLNYLCDPISKQPLTLENASHDSNGEIISGNLKSSSGAIYPIINGIPRFIDNAELSKTVESFGDEWNFFNFIDFKVNWLNHTVKNTFGSTEIFKDKIVVDAGGGSGSQTRWILESGAKHVIMMDLSHAVDDVVQRNLKPTGFTNYDVIQCSIDAPPLKEQSIDGMVICHNVIQHTPSVEKTAESLFELVAPGSEFMFNCYPTNDDGIVRWVRFHLVYEPLRAILSRLPFWAILSYARLMGIIRVVPGLGWVAEKSGFCVCGDVPKIEGESFFARLKRTYKSTVLNTFDGYGSHEYQHHKTNQEIRDLLTALQPDAKKILNADEYLSQPQPIGCGLRVFR
jgi:ubiquinone/menaquinone biosynthesis C-methylase UbiE